MKKILKSVALVAALLLLLTGCAAPETQTGETAQTKTVQTAAPQETAVPESTMQKYSSNFFDTFDTVISLTGYAASQEDFNHSFEAVHDLFLHWHQLCDAYNHYDGIVNVYDLNRQATQGPVTVGPELFGLIQYAKDLYTRYGGANIAMGSVLFLWHDARTAAGENSADAYLPEDALLQAAAEHTSMDSLILDEENQTVYFSDPELRLDLGCIAKGYTTEIAAKTLAETMPSFILNAGGNVRLGNAPLDGRTTWTVGIQNPDDLSGIIGKVRGVNESVVTSGDYQRAYVVNGKSYHHIIDPKTLYPSEYARSVTVVCADSGFADYLSTTLFVLPYEEGRALADSLGVQAVWMLMDGTLCHTDGISID